jgi:hypothetical protein
VLYCTNRKFSTWLIQITINEARMELREDHCHLYDSLDEPKTDEEGDYWPLDFADWREILSESLEQKELRGTLNQAVDSLSPNTGKCSSAAIFSSSVSRKNAGTRHKRIQRKDQAAARSLADAPRSRAGVDGRWSRGRKYEKVRLW